MEQWISIDSLPRYANLSGYDISDKGRVRSRKRRGAPLVLKTQSDEFGRLSVTLCNGPYVKTVRIHQLVAAAFVPGASPGLEVCHRDGNVKDNRAQNLYWGTHRENLTDTVRHGRHVNANKPVCSRGHELTEPNLVPSSLKAGRRDCKSCHNARVACGDKRYRAARLGLSVQEVADEHYRRIKARRQ